MRLVGLIRRRLLVNFRVHAEVMRRLLPAPFRPKLLAGEAVAGVCLIRLERIRPRWLPAGVGLSSENAAHRVAVTWEDATGVHDGVYIPRRDTGSRLNRWAGGRLFPGEHHAARFEVEDDGDRVDLRMRSADGACSVEVGARRPGGLPETSRFPSLEEAASFFASGSVGYSETAARRHLDGIELRTPDFRVEPLAVDRARSSWFEDTTRFPRGSVSFDCALVVRDLPHEWVAVPELLRQT
jgi:hypothetical protein